jgi:hypothetical protein
VQAPPFVPSHEPAHFVPSLAHFERPPTGAPVTGLHTPGVTAHDSHWPSHLELQQTASTQKPLKHSCVDPHDAPAVCFATHAPPAVQNAAASQSVSLVHEVLHAVAPHV